MASVHQKQPVPKVAVSRLPEPVILPAADVLLSECVNDIVLFGFSPCAQEGEKKVKNEPTDNSDPTDKRLSHNR